MKNLKKVQGAKALSVNEQKEVFGGSKKPFVGNNDMSCESDYDCRGFGNYCCHPSKLICEAYNSGNTHFVGTNDVCG